MQKPFSSREHIARKLDPQSRKLSTIKEEVNLALHGNTITMGELAEFLRLHPSMRLHSSAIYRMLRHDELHAVKVGSGWSFSREAVNRLFESHNQTIIPPPPRRSRTHTQSS